MEHGVVESEEMKGNCCAAQTFSYKKLTTFISVSAEFLVLTPVAMFT